MGSNLPPYQTSLMFIISPPDAGPGCGVTGTGYVGFIGGPPKSSSGDPGPRQIDGANLARVRCRISGTGPHSLDLSADKNGATFSLVDGTVAGGTGTAHITMAGAGTGSAPMSGVCNLDVATRPFLVGDGRIWAAFNCPSVANATKPDARCQAQGEFVFENCDP
jgi:hypothetical protein